MVGMITDRDIAVRAVAQGKSPDTLVRDVMSREVLYCFDDQEVKDITRTWRGQGATIMVVNRDKRLVGIISLGDLALQRRASADGKRGHQYLEARWTALAVIALRLALS